MQIGVWISLAAYFVLMLAIGVYAWRKSTSNSEEYMLGGRSLPPAVAALSAGASDMSGWLLLGLPGALFVSGLAQSWIGIGLFVGALINWIVVAPRLRQQTEEYDNSLTIPGFLGNRFPSTSRLLRIVSAIVIVVFFAVYTASGLVGGGKLFASAFGGDYMTGVVVTLGVVLVYLSDLARGLPLGWFRRHETRALFAVLIAVVMGVYALVLAATWQPQGLFKLADIGLHYATPIVYLGWWLLMRPRGRIRFRRIPALLVSPLLYLAYVMVRGAMTGLYPYPFLQADTLGYGQVALNAVSLLVVTSLLLAAAIAVNNRMAEKDAVA